LKETENPGPYSEQMRGKGNPGHACEEGEMGATYIMYLFGNKKEKDPGLACETNIDPGPTG
jgi:hypothetical protein